MGPSGAVEVLAYALGLRKARRGHTREQEAVYLEAYKAGVESRLKWERGLQRHEAQH